ncbi:MAG: cytochrome c [Acidobacteriaceae bacterium]|nr:cytochrome c [Acidobacteriaceae bacterium]
MRFRRLIPFLSCALGALALSGCHRLPPPKPLSQLNAEESHGHAVFQAHCAQCHFDRSDGSLRGPSLLGLTKKPYLPSGAPSNDERITATILHGRDMMPAQQDIDDLEMHDLLAYLHTL